MERWNRYSTSPCHKDKYSKYSPKRYLRKQLGRGAEGTILLELLFNLSLAGLLLGLMTEAVVSLVHGTTALTKRVETRAMWANASRVLREDVHAANKLQSYKGSFAITEVDGRAFEYLVNSAAQFVRVQKGGGTAVVAVGVQSMTSSVSSNRVMLNLSFLDGSTYTIDITSLNVIS